MPLPPLGPRGEGWTAVQVLLMFATIVIGVAGPAWPDEASSFLRGTGIVIGIAGAVLFVGGFVEFRGSPSPFPRPRERSRLLVGGAYGLVRHPIYGGLILITLGWSLASSPLALAATVALTLVLEGKSRVEESMLGQRFPEYDAYMQRVRWRFVPLVH
jgi:protein-S-isoprenylcysteine O-methyltransferase Ste14